MPKVLRFQNLKATRDQQAAMEHFARVLGENNCIILPRVPLPAFYSNHRLDMVAVRRDHDRPDMLYPEGMLWIRVMPGNRIFVQPYLIPVLYRDLRAKLTLPPGSRVKMEWAQEQAPLTQDWRHLLGPHNIKHLQLQA